MVKYAVLALALAATACASDPVVAEGMDCQLLQPRSNLVAACVDIRAADQRIRAAQVNNNGQLGGHGSAARAALQRAYSELLAAAAYANNR